MGGTTTSTPTMAANLPTGEVNTHAFELQISISKVATYIKIYKIVTGFDKIDHLAVIIDLR